MKNVLKTHSGSFTSLTLCFSSRRVKKSQQDVEKSIKIVKKQARSKTNAKASNSPKQKSKCN